MTTATNAILKTTTAGANSTVCAPKKVTTKMVTTKKVTTKKVMTKKVTT